MFLYFDATFGGSFGGALLSPLLEFQNSPQYTQPYAAADLGMYFSPTYVGLELTLVQGTGYPIASGDNTPHSQRVERECSHQCLARITTE